MHLSNHCWQWLQFLRWKTPQYQRVPQQPSLPMFCLGKNGKDREVDDGNAYTVHTFWYPNFSILSHSTHCYFYFDFVQLPFCILSSCPFLIFQGLFLRRFIIPMPSSRCKRTKWKKHCYMTKCWILSCNLRWSCLSTQVNGQSAGWRGYWREMV